MFVSISFGVKQSIFFVKTMYDIIAIIAIS